MPDNNLLQDVARNLGILEIIGKRNEVPILGNSVAAGTGGGVGTAGDPNFQQVSQFPQAPQPQQLPLMQTPSLANLMPQQSQAPQEVQKQVDEQVKVPRSALKAIMQFAIPAITAGIGMGVPGALPGAAGFAGGFEKERIRQSEEETKSTSGQAKIERDQWNDAYKTAQKLRTTGIMGSMQETTPEQLDALAREVYKIKFGDTKMGAGIEEAEKRTKEIQAGDELVTIKFNDGKTSEMTADEARQRGYE